VDGRGREWATPVLNNYLTTVADRGPEAGDDGAKQTVTPSSLACSLAPSFTHSLSLGPFRSLRNVGRGFQHASWQALQVPQSTGHPPTPSLTAPVNLAAHSLK